MAITSELPPTRGPAKAPRPEEPSAGEQLEVRARRGRSAWRACAAQRPGQSMVEIALVLPPVLMLLLIAANAGLALHARTVLAQATQQAAQIFLHHPEQYTSCNSGLDNINGYATLASVQSAKHCYQDDVTWYLHNHGFADINAPNDAGITVTTSTDTENLGTSQPEVQIITVSVDYGFPLVAPVLDSLSFGPLKNGKFDLGAVASTIGETWVPTIQSVTQSGSTFTVSVNAPANPSGAAGMGLMYCGYYSVGTSNAKNGPFCSASSTSSPTSVNVAAPDCDVSDTTCTFYATALQANDLESPVSGGVSVTQGP